MIETTLLPNDEDFALVQQVATYTRDNPVPETQPLIEFSAAQKAAIVKSGIPEQFIQTLFPVLDEGHIFFRSVKSSARPALLGYALRTMPELPIPKPADCSQKTDRVDGHLIATKEELERINFERIQKIAHEAHPTSSSRRRNSLIVLPLHKQIPIFLPNRKYKMPLARIESIATTQAAGTFAHGHGVQLGVVAIRYKGKPYFYIRFISEDGLRVFHLRPDDQNEKYMPLEHALKGSEASDDQECHYTVSFTSLHCQYSFSPTTKFLLAVCNQWKQGKQNQDLKISGFIDLRDTPVPHRIGKNPIKDDLLSAYRPITMGQRYLITLCRYGNKTRPLAADIDVLLICPSLQHTHTLICHEALGHTFSDYDFLEKHGTPGQIEGISTLSERALLLRFNQTLEDNNYPRVFCHGSSVNYSGDKSTPENLLHLHKTSSTTLEVDFLESQENFRIAVDAICAKGTHRVPYREPWPQAKDLLAKYPMIVFDPTKEKYINKIPPRTSQPEAMIRSSTMAYMPQADHILYRQSSSATTIAAASSSPAVAPTAASSLPLAEESPDGPPLLPLSSSTSFVMSSLPPSAAIAAARTARNLLDFPLPPLQVKPSRSHTIAPIEEMRVTLSRIRPKKPASSSATRKEEKVMIQSTLTFEVRGHACRMVPR
ncbi:MAG: hypothetical protein A2103_03265 [Gammaproteobacteria bacterium GWF2_41_13]|nr:MAG: hypothetical protein A2103_03265 [Gammaproteobacteria bacterium GWF2_41_13]